MGDLVRARPQPAKYIDIPILEILLRRVEGNLDGDNATVAAAIGILNHYFPVHDGFIVTSQPGSSGDIQGSSNVLVRQYIAEDGTFLRYLFAEVKPFEERVDGNTHEGLHDFILNCHDNPDSSWAIFIHGLEILFYRMEDPSLEDPHFYGVCALSRPSRYQFHLRHDTDTVHEMLLYFATNESPQIGEASP